VPVAQARERALCIDPLPIHTRSGIASLRV
jgi:hypothetical protein